MATATLTKEGIYLRLAYSFTEACLQFHRFISLSSQQGAWGTHGEIVESSSFSSFVSTVSRKREPWAWLWLLKLQSLPQ